MSELKVLRENELQDKVGLFVGTRPGIIKFSPLMRELQKRGRDFFIIHTGQHYSYDMDKIFFDELELPEPRYKFLDVAKSRTHGGQTAKMLARSEKALMKERPRIVLVCGDANTNLAGALAARKLHIKVGHVESGLRSDDWRMPEEHNRIMIDHISEFLFAPTEQTKRNLIEDNVRGKIFVTGNTIVDAVEQNLDIARKKSVVLDKLGLTSQKYFLFTLHREESVDFKENLRSILQGIKVLSEAFDYPIIFPTHPRTKKTLKYFKLDTYISKIKNLNIIDPLGYLDFLMLSGNAALVLTDSGGIQEESCILKVPCVTLRQNTERPETTEVGANYIAGTEPDEILNGARAMLGKKPNWENPFGKSPSKKIIDIVENSLSGQ
ncbi:MAG: UDP-N-acetylglucosamine 2-epimerase (non-hydrolyzing) [Chloroflexi bacterium]|jgi:UDP-N-acetylglucosamine 2-epimerase (non-hydrolysing)|nr:UDP-N-acetylglucosamine 2-epimerase (non-hydrolyzing) [Chloroflexota bacterium]